MSEGNSSSCVGGDFNLIRTADDKSSGHANFKLMDNFNAFISANGLMEIKQSGPRFTWTNKQARPIMVNLDRILVSASWEMRFPLCNSISLTRVGSDHCPIVFETGDNVIRKQKRFFFEKKWFEQENFLEVVQEKWKEIGSKTPVNIYSLDNWNGRLVVLRQFLKGWGANTNGKFRKEKWVILDLLSKVDNKAEELGLCTEEWLYRYRLERDLEKMYAMEENYWHQRGDTKWIVHGDTNTSYFHSCANGRRRKNSIFSLVNEGEILTEDADISDHIYQFYKKLFGKDGSLKVSVSSNFWHDSGLLSDSDNVSLVQKFSEVEVWDIIKSLGNDSTLGPDGFPTCFYKSFWGVIKYDFMRLVLDFFEDKLDLKRLNFGVISLIHKSKEALNIKQFRPICLLNVSFKIITKLLAVRLGRVANKIISKCQTAFIKGRSILDGVVSLYEVLHGLRVSKSKGVILKLDFEKAYDKIQWGFLAEVMRGKGFSDKWINWVMSSVTGGKVSINVNGSVGPYFSTHRGLRQGDPLSPLLFNLAADALAVMIDKANQRGLIKGVFIKCFTWRGFFASVCR